MIDMSETEGIDWTLKFGIYNGGDNSTYFMFKRYEFGMLIEIVSILSRNIHPTLNELSCSSSHLAGTVLVGTMNKKNVRIVNASTFYKDCMGSRRIDNVLLYVTSQAEYVIFISP